MTEQTTDRHASSPYRERLFPGFGLFVAWLLIIPAVALLMLPINSDAAIPAGIGMYALVVLVMLGMSPLLEVRDGTFTAGRAQIPVELLGRIEALGSEALRAEIGPGSDARNHLVVRGWIHRGLKIEIVDENDPTPYWIVTSRKPLALAEALGAQG